MKAGQQIHKGFRTDLLGNGKEIRIKGAGRADAVVGNIIYELKPNNPRAITQGLNQLARYNKALGGGYQMVLVLY